MMTSGNGAADVSGDGVADRLAVQRRRDRRIARDRAVVAAGLLTRRPASPDTRPRASACGRIAPSRPPSFVFRMSGRFLSVTCSVRTPMA